MIIPPPPNLQVRLADALDLGGGSDGAVGLAAFVLRRAGWAVQVTLAYSCIPCG